MKKINVFLSSAIHELESEREILSKILFELNLTPVLFEVLPALSQNPFEAYIEEVKKCDIFILLVWKSFSRSVQEEYNKAIATNKPILIFVKNLITNEKREKELINFLDELYSPNSTVIVRRTVFKNFRKLSELEIIARDSVISEIEKFYQEPIHTLSKEEMYELGTTITTYAQKRLYIFQKTPSIFLGARDYFSSQSNKIYHEVQLLDSIEKWIDKNKSNTNKEFLYLFSKSETIREIEKHNLTSNKNYIEELIRKIKYYKKVEKNSGYRFRFCMIDIHIAGPIIIGDNIYATWILGDHDAVSISQENGNICNIISRILKAQSQIIHSSDEVIKELGIV